MRVILDTNVVVSGLTFSRDRAPGLGIGPPRTVRLVLFFLHLGRGSRGFGPQVQLSRTPDLTVAPTQDVHWPTRLEVALSKSMFEVTCWRRAERSCDNGPATFQRHPRSLAVSGNAIGFTHDQEQNREHLRGLGRAVGAIEESRRTRRPAKYPGAGWRDQPCPSALQSKTGVPTTKILRSFAVHRTL